MGCKKVRHHWVIAAALGVFATGAAYADTAMIPAGNALIRPAALQSLIREGIAGALEAQMNRDSFTFRSTSGIKESIKLPPQTGTLKQVLDILGIKERISLSVPTIQAGFTLPNSGLKIDVKALGNNQFIISAQGTLTALKAKVNSLNIRGTFFNQAVTIASSPVEVRLKSGSKPIQFSMNILADLNPEGAKLKLKSFQTNLNSSNPPAFAVALGPLSINHSPLTLQLETNGQTLTASEPTIRAELQKLEGTYAEEIRAKLVASLLAQTGEIDAALQKQKFKLDFSSDEMMVDSSMNPNIRKLFSGIDVSFVPSYFQTLKKSDLESMQLTSSLCFDNQCLTDQGPVTPISGDDLKTMANDTDMGGVIYESFLQSFFNSNAFQKRIAAYYLGSNPSPGVALSWAGVKVYLDPAHNGILAILNLEIDIKKTIAPGSRFGQRLKLRVGDMIEQYFGSGKLVTVPVPILLQIGGIQTGADGAPNLVLKTSLPGFTVNNTFTASDRCNTADCPNNIPNMTRYVRPSFLESLQDELTDLVPKQIEIPFGQPVTFKSFSFTPGTIQITPNHGLMFTGKMGTLTSGGKP